MGVFRGVFLVSVDIIGDIFFISSDEIIQKTPHFDLEGLSALKQKKYIMEIYLI